MSAPNQLSFLPDDYLEQRAQRRTNIICSFLFVCAIGGIGGAFYISERADAKVNRQYSAVNTEYLDEAKRIEQAKQIQEKQKTIARQAELTAALLERVPRSYMLAEITNSLPPGVSLLDLSMESRERKPPAPPAAKTAFEQKKAALKKSKEPAPPPLPQPKLYDVTLRLTGIAATDVQVAQFISKLNGQEVFRDVNLIISETLEQDAEVLRKFQIEMALNPKAEAPADAEQQRNKTVSVELEAQ